MYKKMVVLLDGSELAEVVFDYAQELSARMDLEIELLNVCTRQDAAQLPMRRAYMERMAEELCVEAEKIRAKYDKRGLAQCIQARGNVVVGYPAEEILKFIDQKEIDLVMMSTHGSTGFKAWDLGAVANKVVHASKVPVWLVPSELRREILADAIPDKPLVVPLSGTKRSGVAISHAVNIMKQRSGQGELVLLHVVETRRTVTLTALDDATEQRTKMKKYLEDLAKPIRESGLSVRTEVLSGEPVETIINYLKSHPTQLLAMATRGKSGLSRMIFGSVTESMIHLVKVTPLLLISGED